MSTRLNWIASNVAFGLVLYLALIVGVSWAQYAIIPFIWVMLLLYMVVFFDESSRKKFAGRVQPVPRWVSFMVDVAFLAMLLFAEWFVTAAVYAISTALVEAIYARERH